METLAVLSSDSGIEIGVLLTIISVVVVPIIAFGLVMVRRIAKGTARFDALEVQARRDKQELDDKITSQTERILDAIGGKVSRAEFQSWLLRLKTENPPVNVPDL